MIVIRFILSWLSWAYYFHLVVCVLAWHFPIKSVGHSPLYGCCYSSLLWSELLDTHCLVSLVVCDV
jgi:hypothetical protein